MATKTISIDIEAYDRLRRARRFPRESFSQVVKRANWPKPPTTAGALLEDLSEAPTLSEAILEGLESAQRSDLPPESPWRGE